jgi:polyhydroxyalkanoate synthase
VTAAAIPDGRGLRGCTAELAADTAAGRLLCRVLIMYSPATAKVGQTPLLIVPPTINKFYVLDLTPGRSLAEYLVRSGPQVFMISWRNPNARHARWDLDAERCGPEKAAPRNLGGGGLTSQSAALGTYVYDH